MMYVRDIEHVVKPAKISLDSKSKFHLNKKCTRIESCTILSFLVKILRRGDSFLWYCLARLRKTWQDTWLVIRSFFLIIRMVQDVESWTLDGVLFRPGVCRTDVLVLVHYVMGSFPYSFGHLQAAGLHLQSMAKNGAKFFTWLHTT